MKHSEVDIELLEGRDYSLTVVESIKQFSPCIMIALFNKYWLSSSPCGPGRVLGAGDYSDKSDTRLVSGRPSGG